MTQTYAKIFFVAGGSGGHVIPALQMYEHFNNKNFDGQEFQSYFITDERGEKFCPNTLQRSYILKTIYQNIKYLPSFLINLFIVGRIFLSERPSAVIGFGGITTIIPALIAWLFKIPVIIHEQNSSMGKANRLVMKYFATRGLVSFANTKNAVNASSIFFTGLPIREEITQKEKIHDDEKVSILIIAGSQGSDFFDLHIPEIISKITLKNPELKDRIIIYEQVRENKIQEITEKYSELGIRFELKPFFDDMNAYIQKSDLLISRAGASTIFEILKAKIPGILIPMKNSAENHQYMNAIELAKIQTEIPLIEEHEVDKLENILTYICTSKKLLISTQEELLKHDLGDAKEKITQNIIEVLNHANN